MPKNNDNDQVWMTLRSRNSLLQRVVLEVKGENAVHFFTAQPDQAEEQYLIILNGWAQAGGKHGVKIHLRSYKDGREAFYPMPVVPCEKAKLKKTIAWHEREIKKLEKQIKELEAVPMQMAAE